MGRRVSILTGGVLFAVGAILHGFAQNLAMLIIVRLLLGFGIESANQGSLNKMFQLSMTIGILFSNLLNYFFAKIGGWGWRLSLAIVVVPALIITISSFCLSETSNSLVSETIVKRLKKNSLNSVESQR